MVCGCKTQRKLSAKIIDITVLVIVLCIIVALFSLPIVFYYVSDYTNFLAASPDTFHKNRSNSSNINITNGQNPFKNSCTTLSITWSRLSINITPTDCNNNPYIGTICSGVLTSWHLCTIEDGDIVIYSNKSVKTQAQHEKDLVQLDSLLVHYKECQQVAIPFLCQYYFPLYDCSNGDIYTASREDCIDISTGICALQWNLAINYGYGDRLPNCQKLSTNTGNSSFTNTSINSTLQNITCREDFININNTCLPRCDRFEQGTHHGSQLLIYSELIASCVALLLCILIVSIYIKNYKTMFSYTSVLLIIVVIDCSVIALLVIIISIDRNGLLCSSTSLIDSLNNPTPFCTLSGAVFHYAIINMMLLWFFHVTIFFYKVVFPFHANRMEKIGQNKYILAVIIFLGLVIPLPAVIVSLSVEDYKYSIHRFPPNICISDGPMWFYSITVIIDVLVGIETYLLFVVFWIIHRKSTFRSVFTKNNKALSTAEKKILIAIVLFIVFSVSTLVHSAIVTAKSDKFISVLTDYFKCEALGHVPGKCNRSEFEHIYSPYMSAISYTLIGLIPLGILNFVLRWRSVKEVTVKSFRRLSRKSSEITNVSSSSSDNRVLKSLRTKGTDSRPQEDIKIKVCEPHSLHQSKPTDDIY